MFTQVNCLISKGVIVSTQYDIVIFGATSFVGQILCQYMVAQYPEGEIAWAAAGRSQSKLNSVVKSLKQNIPTIIADSDDEMLLRYMAEQSKVIISTVGPYALYGSSLVKVCAESGTDYVDLTGEPQWIRKMINLHEATAKASGARIVHCCGFDSIPLDLGNFYLQQQAQKVYCAPCTTVKMAVYQMKGAGSGGTFASGINMFKEASTDAELSKGLKDPYFLCSKEHGFSAVQRDVQTAVYDEDFDAWVAPFVMAVINTKIVHRSNELNGKAFGEKFKYDEVIRIGKGFGSHITASAIGLGMRIFPLAITLPPSGYLIEKILPKPGEGPSVKQQNSGFFDLRFIGKTDAGQRLTVKVTGDKDPGYGSTAKMLVQAGLCLAQDISKAKKAGGFWTTATVMGEPLIKRLTERAGLTFTLLD